MLDTTMPALPAANDPVDEPALVRAAAAGDTAAYELLYRRHAPRVKSATRRVCPRAGPAGLAPEDRNVRAVADPWRKLRAQAEMPRLGLNPYP